MSTQNLQRRHESAGDVEHAAKRPKEGESAAAPSQLVFCPWCGMRGHTVWQCIEASLVSGVMEFCPICLDNGKDVEHATSHAIDECTLRHPCYPRVSYERLAIDRVNMPRWRTSCRHWELIAFERSARNTIVPDNFPWSDNFSREFAERAARGPDTAEAKTIALYYNVLKMHVLPQDSSQTYGDVLAAGELMQKRYEAERKAEEGRKLTREAHNLFDVFDDVVSFDSDDEIVG